MLVEKSINLLRLFHFIEMLSKSFFKFTFSLANILQTFTLSLLGKRDIDYKNGLGHNLKCVLFFRTQSSMILNFDM